MKQCAVVWLALARVAFGQGTQIGGLVGRGGAAQLFENSAYHVVIGAEACVWCGGRLGVFAEYHHWQKTGTGTDEPVSLDLAGGGLRIQGKGRRVRPFFDIGFTAGTEERSRPRRGVVGGMIGFGAAISIGEHWYVRPMARIIGLSSFEYGGFGGAAVGWRF